MTRKRWNLAALLFMATTLVTAVASVSAESRGDFRKENGLQEYFPAEWFLRGHFIACEKDPRYVFGPVRDFTRALGGKTTWLIEDMELERLRTASAAGRKIEYSVFLEAASPDRTEYWVFVVLPYESAQEWHSARRAYHGGKAEGYYGKTRNELERAMNQGLTIAAELRFWIDRGETSLKAPENVIMSTYRIQPVFDLREGRRPDAGAGAK